MLKKQDLTKQFELVVKQEIKNYQDSLNFVLQSIRELKENVDHVHQEQLENYAALHSSYIGLQGDVAFLKDLCFSQGIKLDKSVRDQKVENDSHDHNVSSLNEDIVKLINNQQVIQAEFGHTLKSVETLRELIEKIDKKLDFDIKNIAHSYQRDIQRTKEDILNAPTRADIVRKELAEKIDCHKVDVDGIMRELNLYKKENHTTEKKIENIYTLIERLQKAEGSK